MPSIAGRSRPSQQKRAAHVRLGSKPVVLWSSIRFPLRPPKPDIRALIAIGESSVDQCPLWSQTFLCAKKQNILHGREIDVTDGAEFMKYANKLSLALLVGLSVAAPSVASAQNMSRRDAAIRKCIQQAHAQYPRYYAGVGTDRTYLYKACMTNMGLRP